MTRGARADSCPPAVRPAVREDVADIVALVEAGTDEPWSADLVARLLDTASCWGLVATRPSTRPAGALLARTAGDEVEILNLVVRPDDRRRGIGGTLLLAALQIARGQGAGAMLLEVGVDNVPARALYEEFGFGVVGRRADYYTRAVDIRADALIMRKLLITLPNE